MVEVLVATSLLAVGLALTFATLRGATRSTQRAEQVAHRDEQLRAAQGFLRTQLNAALLVAFEFKQETGEASFLRGSGKKLQFVGLMPGYLGRGGPYLQTLELLPGRDGQQLVFRFQMLTGEGAADPERDQVVLLDGIDEGGFHFRSLDEAGKPGSWQSEWEVSGQLPPLVKLEIRFRDAARRWPDFVAAPRLGVPFNGAPVLPLATDEESGGM